MRPSSLALLVLLMLINLIELLGKDLLHVIGLGEVVQILKLVDLINKVRGDSRQLFVASDKNLTDVHQHFIELSYI